MADESTVYDTIRKTIITETTVYETLYKTSVCEATVHEAVTGGGEWKREG